MANDLPTAGPTRPNTPSETLPPTTTGPTTIPIRFNGIGSEYFGIWIVNTMLMMLTLGLYYPWARVRKLVYFAESTDVGGYPLSFHGKAKQMFAPFIVAALGFVAYAITQEVMPLIAVSLLALFSLAWPWIFRAANRFRLSKTEWRGLRLGFLGTTIDAYKAIMIPIVIGGLLYAASIFLSTFAPDEETLTDANKSTAIIVGVVLIGLLLVSMLVFPLFHYLLKRYQHSNFAYASLSTSFSASASDFYLLFLKTIGVAVIGLLPVAVPVGLVAYSVIDFSAEEPFQNADFGLVMGIFLLFVISFILFRLWFVVASTYWQAGLFNLVWPNTKTRGTRFVSSLSFRKLLGVKLLNTVLILLTMGFYLPFAQLALARLKLHSLHIESDTNLDDIIADVRSGKTSAAADIAADVLDIDIGI